MFSVMLVGTTLLNLFPTDSSLPIHLAIAFSIIITGVAVGKLINLRIKQLPLYHAIGIALVAATYKLFRPDFYPLTSAMLIVFFGLTFISIVIGTYVTTTKSA
jgi:hypothetical protein